MACEKLWLTFEPQHRAQYSVTIRYSPLDPQATLIHERDVYRLVMRSKLPAAERFRPDIQVNHYPETGWWSPCAGRNFICGG